MRTLYLLRHGRTEANERRLYCGGTDLPLSPDGRREAREIAINRPLPECGLYITSGMVRANETLEILTGHRPDRTLPEFREMDFGRFEMLSYETLRHDADYLRWIGDESGATHCPGGESSAEFRGRVLGGSRALLGLDWKTALLVCHGGVIVNLMGAWFPGENHNFYEWQPAACMGWRVDFDERTPVRFEAV